MAWAERARRARATAEVAAGGGGRTAGTPVEVVRLDVEGARYILTPLLDGDRVTGLVETDGEGGEVRRVGLLTGADGFVPVTEGAARKRASAADPRPPVRVFLGWRPCRQSWDGFNPFWVIEFEDGERRFVDQAGRMHEALDPGGPGG